MYEKYWLSKETFEEKINRLENTKPITFYEECGFSSNDISYMYYEPLFHGLRFDPINRLESIIKIGKILPSSKIPDSYESMDGRVHYSHVFNYDDNCNEGKYVSVTPYNSESAEYYGFVGRNIHFQIKGNIEAYKAHHLYYDEFYKAKAIKNKKNYYSYAFEEYFIKEVSLEDITSINIDTRYFQSSYVTKEEAIEKVIEIMKYYKVEIPFVDISTGTILYSFEKNKEQIKTLIKDRNS